MKRSMICVASIFMLSLALAAQERVLVGAIDGTVLDAQGKPVADASVTIQTSDGLHPHATHSDASGHFEFARWRVGQYDLRAYANGLFSEWSKRIMIRTNKTTHITLRLSEGDK
jgi:protocatechuate 3,4-dioxygenase beta subunit